MQKLFAAGDLKFANQSWRRRTKQRSEFLAYLFSLSLKTEQILAPALLSIKMTAIGGQSCLKSLLPAGRNVLDKIAFFEIAARRDPHEAFELAVEMALITKAGCIRHFGERPALGKELLCAFHPQID